MSSGRNFASTFLQIPCHHGHPWSWLVIPATRVHRGLSPPSCCPCQAHAGYRPQADTPAHRPMRPRAHTASWPPTMRPYGCITWAAFLCAFDALSQNRRGFAASKEVSCGTLDTASAYVGVSQRQQSPPMHGWAKKQQRSVSPPFKRAVGETRASWKQHRETRGRNRR